MIKDNAQQSRLLISYHKIAKKVTFALLCALLLMLSGCSSRDKNDPNYLFPENFYSISDELFRSEQPTHKEMQYLDQQGFKTVINLRLWHSDRDEVEGTGISEVWIRMRAGNVTDEKMIEILQAIHTSPKPILVHCWHGSDLTGVVVAMYRLVFQNWDKQRAIAELMKPKFGHHYNIYPNIVKYIENVDIEKIKNAVFES